MDIFSKSFFLYKIINRKLKPLDTNLISYQEIYNLYNFLPQHNEKCILVVYDFLSNRIEQNSANIFLNKLLNELKKINIKIYFKLHPEDKQNVQIIKSEYPNIHITGSELDAEHLCIALNPIVILSGVSTSAFTIPTIFSKPTINYSKLYKDFIINKDMKKQIKKQNAQFDWNSEMIFVTDFEQISTKINDIYSMVKYDEIK